MYFSAPSRAFNIRSAVLATLAAASLPLISPPSRAADPPPGAQPSAQTIHYADLDLNSNAGVAQLYQRILTAAAALCDESSAPSLEAWSSARACRSESVARAVETIGNPKLAALHLRKAAQLAHQPKVIS
ncbi:MAG: UrcA family protein [Steroidobacteraceae bacterium]